MVMGRLRGEGSLGLARDLEDTCEPPSRIQFLPPF